MPALSPQLAMKSKAMSITQKLNYRSYVIRKCEEARAAIQRVGWEPEHPAHAEVMADLRRCLALWRNELDKIELLIR